VRAVARPAKPDITRVGNKLQTIPWSGYQWYLNGAAIPGATSPSLIMSTTGSYQVEVFNEYGCSSISRVFEVLVLDVADPASRIFSCEIYPEPALETVTLDLTLPSPGAVNTVLSDVTGRVLVRRETESSDTRQTMSLNVAGLPPGVYVLRVFHGKSVYARIITKM
jgi:hypothetical protein